MASRFELESLRAWATQVLKELCVPEADARLTAELLVRAEARGLPSHGIGRLPSYVQKLRSGEVNARPVMRWHERPGLVTLQADGALGQVAAWRTLERGLALLADAPVVACRLIECGHLGALGLYALRVAEAGSMAIVAQRTPPLMSLPGMLGPVIGNNPLAFASPVRGRQPLLVDMASSVTARGHILLRARSGEKIPQGWALDASGKPTTDADAALSGALLPSGGHKGLALAMLVEMLAGALSATPESVRQVSAQVRVPASGAVGRQSAFFLLVNAQALGGPDTACLAADYMRAWCEDYLGRGGPQARLPGRRGAQAERTAHRDGLRIDEATLTELKALGAELGHPLPPSHAEGVPSSPRGATAAADLTARAAERAPEARPQSQAS